MVELVPEEPLMPCTSGERLRNKERRNERRHKRVWHREREGERERKREDVRFNTCTVHILGKRMFANGLLPNAKARNGWEGPEEAE